MIFVFQIEYFGLFSDETSTFHDFAAILGNARNDKRTLQGLRLDATVLCAATDKMSSS